ncbi:hypothetical protein DOC35_19350 [Salmonella enterica subsp. enterica]|nr:hypothetical protein [Salmonella enterica subsp. enterica]
MFDKLRIAPQAVFTSGSYPKMHDPHDYIDVIRLLSDVLKVVKPYSDFFAEWLVTKWREKRKPKGGGDGNNRKNC